VWSVSVLCRCLFRRFFSRRVVCGLRLPCFQPTLLHSLLGG
jgi:hypothetical protein